MVETLHFFSCVAKKIQVLEAIRNRFSNRIGLKMEGHTVQRAKSKHLVIDTAGFITNVPLEKFGEDLVTLHDVVDEIRDKETKQRLKVLPFELNYMEPTTEVIARGKTSQMKSRFVCSKLFSNFSDAILEEDGRLCQPLGNRHQGDRRRVHAGSPVCRRRALAQGADHEADG